MLETKKEKLEVKVLVGVDPNLTNFDHSKQSLIYDCTNETTQEIKDLVTSLVSTSNKTELEHFSPFIENVFSLQEIQNISYDKENEEESLELYKKFDGLTAAVRVDEVFKPIYEEAKSKVDTVNNIKKAFKNELKAKKELLKENFKEYLDEQLRLKEEKAAKAKAKADLEINALKEANAESQEKALKLEKEKAISDLKEAISNIQTTALANIPFINLQGLDNLRFNICDTMFESIQKENSKLIPEEELKELNLQFEKTKIASVQAIDDKIALIKSQQKVQEMQQQMPESLNTVPNETFQQVPQQQVQSQLQTPQSLEKSSDLELLAEYNSIVKQYAMTVENLTKNLQGDLAVIISNVKDPNLQNILKKLPTESLNNIFEWMEKSKTWSEKVKMKYEQFLSQ